MSKIYLLHFVRFGPDCSDIINQKPCIHLDDVIGAFGSETSYKQYFKVQKLKQISKTNIWCVGKKRISDIQQLPYYYWIQEIELEQ